MDQTTPQYAALVEQMAAAAGSLKSQALDLVQNGDVFKNSQSRPTTGFQSVGGGSAGHESSYHISPRKPKANDAAPPRLGNAAKSIGLNK